ncbi:MAG: MGMT family protein [Thermoplasmata archaeon]
MTTLTLLREVIAGVPRGKVITYGEVAKAAGFPGAARLTVWALQRGEGLPWHRVVAAGGRIALPGGPGQEQRLRLEIEGVTFRGGRVRMDLHRWSPRGRKRSRSPRDGARSRRPSKARGPSTTRP